MHAGLHGGAKRTEHNANKSKSQRPSVLSRFRRKTTKVRRINVHEMNGNVKTSRKRSTTNERKISALDPRLYAGTGALLGSVASLSASEKTERIMKNGESSDVIKDHEFHFENLVFEGGGNKGMAYVGALQVLEEAGIMRNIKRVAGASAGAIIATLISLGFDSEELKEFLDQDLRLILVDHTCGYCSLLPNLLKGFGWNPGKKLLKWFGDQLKERTGDSDITFKEILERYGKELCIVVTNLNQMSVEYFHPKTTPNTPVRRAVRMSVALPGVFQCVREMNNDYEDVYVDGGLLCNYPIHAFDGWWLSMDPKDTFFKKLQPLEDFARLFEKSERFGKWNEKTLGIVLFSHTETELMKTLLSEREGNKPPEPPATKLSKQRLKLQDQQLRMKQEHIEVVHAVGRFIKELQRNNLDEDSIINLKELKGVFIKPKDFTKEDAELLFGSNANYKKAFEELDTDEDGEITFQELMAFIEKKGVNLQTRFLGYSRKEIRHLGDFIQTLQTALSVNVKRVYVEKRDVERTIGIDTDYIETNDFFLDAADKRFLIESGKRATRAFLREHVKRMELREHQPVTVSVRAASQNSSVSQDHNSVADHVESASLVNTPRSSVVSIDSLEGSAGSQGLHSNRKKSGALRLPPLPKQAGMVAATPVFREHEDSGESVTSAGKVDFDVRKSPTTGRTNKVGVVQTIV